MTSKLLLLIMIAASVVLSACSTAPQSKIISFEECVAAGNAVMESYPRQCRAGGETFVEQINNSQKLIGGDRDEHYCLVGAGYSYDKDVGACTRSWEFDTAQKEAAAIAVKSIQLNDWTVTAVNATNTCDSCYTVVMQRDTLRNTVTIINGNVSTATGGEWPCTREYRPVCGAIQVQCIRAPCPPINTTFSNLCEAQAAGAFNIHSNACTAEEVNPESACLTFDGTWIQESQECEGMPQEMCVQLGGTFNECASACRNDPDAEICTMQCVQVCSFTH